MLINQVVAHQVRHHQVVVLQTVAQQVMQAVIRPVQLLHQHQVLVHQVAPIRTLQVQHRQVVIAVLQVILQVPHLQAVTVLLQVMPQVRHPQVAAAQVIHQVLHHLLQLLKAQVQIHKDQTVLLQVLLHNIQVPQVQQVVQLTQARQAVMHQAVVKLIVKNQMNQAATHQVQQAMHRLLNQLQHLQLVMQMIVMQYVIVIHRHQVLLLQQVKYRLQVRQVMV